MDVNLPRDKETGKTKGFGFLMYEDQRSTVLAVDNLNGATVLDRTLRVDHVKNYKQPKTKGEDGEWIEAEEQALNAKPGLMNGASNILLRARRPCRYVYAIVDAGSESSASSEPDIDPDDPMRDYLLQKWKEEHTSRKKKRKKSKSKHKDETPEERRVRKERKKEKKARKQAGKSDGLKGVEALLASLDNRGRDQRDDDYRRRSLSPRRDLSASPGRFSKERFSRRDRSHSHSRSPRRSASRSRSPPKGYGFRTARHEAEHRTETRRDDGYLSRPR